MNNKDIMNVKSLYVNNDIHNASSTYITTVNNHYITYYQLNTNYYDKNYINTLIALYYT